MVLHLTQAQITQGTVPRVVYQCPSHLAEPSNRFITEVVGEDVGDFCPIESAGGWKSWQDQRRQVTEYLADADIVHMHGLWSLASLFAAKAAKQRGCPYIMRPAGMLEPWSLTQKKWKKKLALCMSFGKLLRNAAVLQGTALSEGEQFRRLGYKNPITIIPNGVNVCDYDVAYNADLVLDQWPQLRDRKRLLFLSRVHPKKALPNLIGAFARLADRFADWDVVIAGPDSDGHGAEILTQAEREGITSRVLMTGPVYGEMKIHLMVGSDLFVLPTHSENFGVAVVEAMAAQIPVITTKGTPWQELTEHNCGWWINIGLDPLTESLEAAMSLSDDERAAMGRRGRELAMNRYAWSAIASQCDQMYRWILGHQPAPDSVQLSA